MSKKYYFIFLLLSLALPVIVNAQPAKQSRNLVSCLSGMRQFLSAGLGYESFTDYWRDFSLWPSQYADVASIENQVNKARYAVVAAFLRCDLNRLQSVTNAYYKLEAELYFVRHFVDTSGGEVRNLIADAADRESFANTMINSLLLRKVSADKEKDRALFRGYFDEFDAKYAERAKSYASFGKDPVFQELGKKFDELIETFKSLSNLGGAMKAAGKEAVKKEEKPAAEESSNAGAAQSPPKSIREKASSFLSKFMDLCVTPSGVGPAGIDITHSALSQSENRYCLLGDANTTKQEFSAPDPNVNKASDKKSFGEIITAISRQQAKQTEDISKAEMLTRYELLYGEVNGGGVLELFQKMNTLNAILGKGIDTPLSGSLEPLAKVKSCLQDALKKQCS